MTRLVARIAALLALAASPLLAQTPDLSKVPGVVIDHIPTAENIYVGSPSIVVLPDGSYLASHDEFGPKSQYHGRAITRVFRSNDRGESWVAVSTVEGCFWANLFVHKGAVYLWGTEREYGEMLLRRSTDGGCTWTDPKDAASGKLLAGNFHCAPVPVVHHAGRLWRAWEEATPGKKWGDNFRPFVMSAPEGADLLDAKSWTRTNALDHDKQWLNGTFGGWLEGNAVVTPTGDIVDILRVQNAPEGETAAIVRISKDGKTATFDPAKDFIHFPGGTKKFTIRFDPQSKRYWSLTNYVPLRHVSKDPGGTRNTLALTSSTDLVNWEVRSIVLYHPDREKHGFQYVDWQFDRDDLIAACRTAYDDGLGGAHRAHDANLLTFHRIPDFRHMNNAPLPDLPGGETDKPATK
jgi:hypothetical protein